MRIERTLGASTAAALALIILGAGCGDNDPSPDGNVATAPATTQAPTTREPEPDPIAEQEAFVSRVDRICERYNRRFQRIDETGGELATLQQIYMLFADGLRALREVSPPASERIRYRQYTSAIEDLRNHTREKIDAVKRGDLATLDHLRDEDERIVSRRNEIALDLGLAECGSTQ